jgi:hypothetical protein
MSDLPQTKSISKAGSVSLFLSLPCIMFGLVNIAVVIEAVLHDRRHKMVEDGMEFTLLSATLFGPLTILALIFGAFARGRRVVCIATALVFPALFDIYFLVEYVL